MIGFSKCRQIDNVVFLKLEKSKDLKVLVYNLPKSVVKTRVRLWWRDVPSDFNAWVLGSRDYKSAAQLIQELKVSR
jgi:hypothetical protein